MASISIAPVPFGQGAAERIAQRIAEDNKGIMEEDKVVASLLKVTARPKLEISRASVEAAAGRPMPSPTDTCSRVWQTLFHNIKGKVTRFDDVMLVIED